MDCKTGWAFTQKLHLNTILAVPEIFCVMLPLISWGHMHVADLNTSCFPSEFQIWINAISSEKKRQERRVCNLLTDCSFLIFVVLVNTFVGVWILASHVGSTVTSKPFSVNFPNENVTLKNSDCFTDGTPCGFPSLLASKCGIGKLKIPTRTLSPVWTLMKRRPLLGWLDSCFFSLWNQFCRNRAWACKKKKSKGHKSDSDFSYQAHRTFFFFGGVPHLERKAEDLGSFFSAVVDWIDK